MMYKNKKARARKAMECCKLDYPKGYYTIGKDGKPTTTVPKGYYDMCSSGCPRDKNMKTKLVGKAREKKFGGPEGYWGI